ncbi:glycosyltransferase family 2 protein [Providencia huaxiensis]|uniref:glycosyltransferase family 2 protein n=1 Tax=Providencia huaxiensis TaxID=2027290 RepID=UPI000C7F12C1|nr:glycosyltransferase family 2 protein [Providencia huaxiensis]AXH63517.1 glycosyltransferase family 2 protein [Providencia huaxiensis]
MNIINPLVSIIMPAYNVEKWIEKSIKSIINQTYENFELIIIDDCSTDSTFNIIKRMSTLDNRIKYARNKENSKICKTLNHGLDISTGDYIARFDADDIATPDRLEKQMAKLIEDNLDLIGCQMITIDESENELSSAQRPIGESLINKTKLLISPISHIWLCKKDIYIKLNNYREIPYAEDYDFILRAIDHGYKCDNHPLPLMYIRHREGNTSTTASLLQRKTHNYVVKLAKERRRNKSLTDSFSEDELKKYISFYKITNFFHKLSTKNLNLAHKTKSYPLKIIYLLFACSSSYYNSQYLIERLIFKYKNK